MKRDDVITASNARLIRVGGISVLLALAIHVYVNGFLKTFPAESLSADALEAYLSAEAPTWAIVHGMKYVALVGLVLFAAGAFARTYRSQSGSTNLWGVVGLLGTSVHVANALIANGIEVLAFYDFSRISSSSDNFWLLFFIVRTLFTAEIVAWGLVIFGFSMAGRSSARIPTWISVLGFLAALGCLLCGAFVVSILNEGRAVWLINIASMLGLLWFASLGVYILLKGDA
ncbi:MAG: hypothetical protein AAF438_10485 [Pseudomonadota bacterium]